MHMKNVEAPSLPHKKSLSEGFLCDLLCSTAYDSGENYLTLITFVDVVSPNKYSFKVLTAFRARRERVLPRQASQRRPLLPLNLGDPGSWPEHQRKRCEGSWSFPVLPGLAHTANLEFF